MRPLKIAYVCSDVDIPILGSEGCSVKIRQFCDALVEAGHDVFVLCSWLGEDRGETTRARIYDIGPTDLDATAWHLLEGEEGVWGNHLERDLRSVLHNLWLKSAGEAIFDRERPDLVYECYSLFGYAGGDLAARFGIPHVLEVNAPLVEEQAGYRKFPFSGTAAALDREIFPRADRIVALSPPLADFVIERGADPARVHVIGNGVGRHFADGLDVASLRARLGLDGKRVIGHVGSFHWWHDVRGLVRAFGELAREDPELRLLLVGQGAERASVEELVEELGLADRVLFTGHVDHGRIPEYLAMMDVGCVPYDERTPDYFGFGPMKLVESMAAGVPTVVAEIGEIAQIVDHGRTGVLYPPGDHQALVRALRDLLGDPDRAQRIGAAARRHALTDYTWQAIVDRILTVARPLLPATADTGAVR